MKIHTIDELDMTTMRGKYVLLRDDMNVQITDGEITDAFRITQSLPTITRLRDAGARIAILAHLGRPAGAPDPQYTLAPVAAELSRLLAAPVPLIPDCIGPAVAAARDGMHDGDVVLLENVRFYAAEEKNDPAFARDLATGFDIYVNDAFAVSHRAHASVAGVTQYLPHFAGELLSSEIAELTHIMENPAHPLVAIVGGAKVSTKVGVLHKLTTIADKIILGGGIGTAFRIATDSPNVHDSLYDPAMRPEILDIMETAKRNNCELFLPLDKGVGKEFDQYADRTDKPFDKIEPDDIIMDDGRETVFRNIDIVKTAKTVLWNGTMGMAEWYPTWSIGTIPLANEVADLTEQHKIESVIGGGDTVAMLEDSDIKDSMTYVSTGGGAFLEFIEGKELPGIAALKI